MAKISKGLIFLKSTVIALGLVLFILLVALIIAKSKKDNNNKSDNKCNNKTLILENKIEQFEIKGNSIFILTKPHLMSQELIQLDLKCQNLISKTTIMIKGKNSDN